MKQITVPGRSAMDKSELHEKLSKSLKALCGRSHINDGCNEIGKMYNFKN